MLFEVPDNLVHLIPAESRAKFLGELAELNVDPDYDNPDVDPFEHPVETKPYNFGGALIRVIDTDPGNIKFIAKDVCEALDVDNASNVLKRLKDDEKGSIKIMTLGGPQKLLFVTQPGALRIVGTCRGPKPEMFQRWMYHEVLMSVQQTGSYSVNEQALRSLEERITREIAGLKVQFGAQQASLVETKLALLGRSEELVQKDQVIDDLAQKAVAAKLVAESNRRSDQQQVVRAQVICSGLKRDGHRALRPDQGWYIRSDLCYELMLPLGYGEHYEHRNVSATTLGRVMRLWGWMSWNEEYHVWNILEPHPPERPLEPETHYRWVFEQNKEKDPNCHSWHLQLYLRSAGLEVIRQRWNKGLLDLTLADELGKVRRGEYPMPPKAPEPLKPQV